MSSTKIPDPATGISKLAGTDSPILTKKAFALRWGLCTRSVDSLLRKGLHHVKLSKRCVRIHADIADKWMLEHYGTFRIGKAKQ